jgi:hypothetical protein
VSDLCIVQCRLLFNLLLDEVECVHGSLLKWVKIEPSLVSQDPFFPVPSVVCVRPKTDERSVPRLTCVPYGMNVGSL